MSTTVCKILTYYLIQSYLLQRQIYYAESMLSSEYCEIFKNTYFEEHLLTAASDFLKHLQNTGEQLFLYWLFY